MTFFVTETSIEDIDGRIHNTCIIVYMYKMSYVSVGVTIIEDGSVATYHLDIHHPPAPTGPVFVQLVIWDNIENTYSAACA